MDLTILDKKMKQYSRIKKEPQQNSSAFQVLLNIQYNLDSSRSTSYKPL